MDKMTQKRITDLEQLVEKLNERILRLENRVEAVGKETQMLDSRTIGMAVLGSFK